MRVAARSRASASGAGMLAAASSISAGVTRSVAADRFWRSNWLVSSTRASSPRARISAIMAATGASTFAVVSRALLRRVLKAA
jgi:hypothetical protein